MNPLRIFFSRPGLLAVLLSGLLASCNHLFYYPDRNLWADPTHFRGGFRDVWFTSVDGTKLHGWLLFPETIQAKGVVVHFHGNAQNLSAHSAFSSWLTSYGYYVWMFDYRGYGQSEGEPDRAGTIKDGMAALRFVERQSQLKHLPVFVFAQSLGGAVAVASLKQKPPRNLKGVVLDSTFSSYRGIAREKLADFWLTWPLQYPLSFLVSDDNNPLEAIHSIPTRWLFIHAADDAVVPMAAVQDLYMRAPEPKTFWRLEKGGHTSAWGGEKNPNRIKLSQWFDAALLSALPQTTPLPAIPRPEQPLERQ